MEAIAVSVIEHDINKTKAISVGEEFRRLLNEKYKVSMGKKVIELGIGRESLIPLLSSKFGEKVFRMELEDWNLRNNKINDGLVRGELQNLPIAPRSVNLVVSMDKFEDHFDLRRIIGEIERILVDDGEAVLVVSGEHLCEGKLAIETGLNITESRLVCAGGDTGDCWILNLRKC